MSIAFFDFDRTLLRHDSGAITAWPSFRRGLLDARQLGRLALTAALVKAGVRRRVDIQHLGFDCMAGKSLAELREAMQDLHDRYMRHFVSRAIRRRVEEHQRAGHRTAVLTASAFWFAEPLVRELGIDDLHGTKLQFDERGVCTGRVAGEILDGAAKLAAARAHAARHGVALPQCTFYSDHLDDLPLLEAVGTPIVVGPKRTLRRLARARGWMILEH